MTSQDPDHLPHGNKQVVNALVLAGGKSTRMGKDKGTLQWHAKEQRLYIADLLRPFCSEVFISCRKEQESDLKDQRYKVITDAYEGMGPYGAILSAFKYKEDCAWLVVACDLPLLDLPAIAQLIEERDPSYIATTFKSPHDGLPEPLVTIWEPSSYPILLASMEEGHKCPRKALINNHVKVIQAANPKTLMNVNTPEELEMVRQLLLNATNSGANY